MHTTHTRRVLSTSAAAALAITAFSFSTAPAFADGSGSNGRCRPDAKERAIAVERELVTRVNTLLGPQGPTVTLAGEYPRSALAFRGVESQTASVVVNPIWPDEDPWDHPLEQQARSFVLTCSTATEQQ